jgi:hypothetical protein
MGAEGSLRVYDKSDPVILYTLIFIGICVATLVLFRVFEDRRAASGRVKTVKRPSHSVAGKRPGPDLIPWLGVAFLILFCPFEGAVHRMFRVPDFDAIRLQSPVHLVCSRCNNPATHTRSFSLSTGGFQEYAFCDQHWPPSDAYVGTQLNSPTRGGGKPWWFLGLSVVIFTFGVWLTYRDESEQTAMSVAIVAGLVWLLGAFARWYETSLIL